MYDWDTLASNFLSKDNFEMLKFAFWPILQVSPKTLRK